jgi:hypothetical protein
MIEKKAALAISFFEALGGLFFDGLHYSHP